MTEDVKSTETEPRSGLIRIRPGQPLTHLRNMADGKVVQDLPLPNPLAFDEPVDLSAAEVLRLGGVDDVTAAAFLAEAVNMVGAD